MNAKKKWWSASRLYLILDKQACGSRDPAIVLREAIRGGVDLVQYRDKCSPSPAMIAQGRRLGRMCRRRGIPFLINDRLDVALEVPCDGLHVGQDDLSVRLARIILGKDAIIGLSCHSPNQIRDAQRLDADYLGFGPVFKTKTKPDVRPRGASELTQALALSKKPVVAIGGISAATLDLLPKTKRRHVAVCRDICQATNIAKATKRLKNEILMQRRSV